jgi:hypothetical protein
MNKVTGEKYIGYTNNSFYSRVKTHFSELLNGGHSNKKLLESYNAYGKSCFEIHLLSVSNEKFDRQVEKYFIDLLKPEFNMFVPKNKNYLFNKTEKWKNSVANSTAQTYYFINPKGENQEVYNLSGFCRENDLSFWKMYNLLRNKKIEYKGWKINLNKYKND